MSDSDSDIGKASDSDGPSNSASRRPKRNAPRKSLAESESSGEDVAVNRAKAKRAKRATTRSESPVLDELFKGVDREKMSNMNELERELNVFKHMEEMEIKKQREEIRRSLMNKEKSKEAKKKGKSAKDSDVQDSSEGEYKSSSESEGEIREPKRKKKQALSDDEDPDMDYHRPSEVHEKRNKKRAMDELLSKRRDKKEAEKKRKETEQGKNVLDIDEIFGGVDGRSSSLSSSSSSSRSSSVSSRTSSGRSPSPDSKKEIESLEDLNKCKISRQMLARFVHLPFFNTLATGCYVRVGIGNHNGVPVYRICEIVDVVETAKVYNLEKTRTNKGIKLKHGADTRVYRLEFVSNQKFTDKEWVQWLQAMRSKNIPLPTVDKVAAKEKDINFYNNYSLTGSEIDYMIKEKQRFLSTPVNCAIEKSRLMKEKADAEEQGNLTKAREIQNEIDELDAKADDAEHQRNVKLSAVALINQKRRDEMRQNFLGSKKADWDPVQQDDPFTRKTQRMKVVSGAPKKKKDEDSQQEVAPVKKEEDSQPTESQISTAGNNPPPSVKTEPSSNGSEIPAPFTFKQKLSAKASGPAKPTPNSNGTKQFAQHTDIDLNLDI